MTGSRAAVVGLPADTQILITRDFGAPRHLVYLAWTTPDLIKRWWSGGRGEVITAEVYESVPDAEAVTTLTLTETGGRTKLTLLVQHTSREKKALPGAVRLRLELLDEHRFASGVVHLRSRRGRLRDSIRACGSSAWTAASTATCTSTAARRASWPGPSRSDRLADAAAAQWPDMPPSTASVTPAM